MIYLLNVHVWADYWDHPDYESELQPELGYFTSKVDAEVEADRLSTEQAEADYAKYVQTIEQENARHAERAKTWMLQNDALRAAGLPELARPTGFGAFRVEPKVVQTRSEYLGWARPTYYEVVEVSPHGIA